MANKKKISPTSGLYDDVSVFSTESLGLRRSERAKVNSTAYLDLDSDHVTSEGNADSGSDSKENVSSDFNRNNKMDNIDEKGSIPSKKSKSCISLVASISDVVDYRSFFCIDNLNLMEEDTTGIMVELNKYYPFPMKAEEPENRNLLYLNTYSSFRQSDMTKFEFMKVFTENAKFYLYFVLDPEKLMKSNLVDCAYLNEIVDYFFCNNIKNGYIHSKHEVVAGPEHVLSDTFDFSEAVIPAGFEMALRGYQLRSVSWMMSVEKPELSDENRINNNVFSDIYEEHNVFANTAQVKVKLGASGYYLNLRDLKISDSAALSSIKPFRVRGGVLADDTGSGKTVTCLALIHSSPFTSELAQWRLGSLGISPSSYIPSRASVVICPSNLHDQWIKEAVRCNPKFKIIGLSCMRDHEKVSWRDVMLADIIVISYQFLINANYIKFVKETYLTTRDLTSNMDKIIDVKGEVDMRHVNFYRVFFDEMHEMGHKTAKCKKIASEFKADFYWGITGTPPKFNSIGDLHDLLPYLNVSKDELNCITKNKMAKDEFLNKFVRRNVPDLKLPQLTTEIVWVTATPSELALMNMMTDRANERDRIMMCSHYQICENITAITGDTFKSMEEVKILILDSNLKELANIKVLYDQNALQMEGLIKEREAADTDKLRLEVSRRIENHMKNANAVASAYKSSENKCNYFTSVFELLNKQIETKDDSSNECLICRDQIQPNTMSILPCAHIYCFDCISTALMINDHCPLCRKEINPAKDILRIASAPETTFIQNADLMAIDTSRYGSKLIALYNYMTTLIRDEPNARVILFIQYRVLTEFISKTLNELNIQHVRVTGNVFQRKKSIESFKTSPSNRVIILSSEDSVSGINLTEATHVIILHPFWTGMGEQTDLAFEKQGICRAYRGGLNHPIKVVRFAVRYTIDEVLTNRRQNAHIQ